MSATAAQLRVAVDRVLSDRAIAAQNSAYDRSVCISAVGAARDVVQAVAVSGGAETYKRNLVAALSPVFETYSDPDGEYTSGRGVIGDILADILRLETQK